jgi:hypothetical protein
MPLSSVTHGRTRSSGPSSTLSKLTQGPKTPSMRCCASTRTAIPPVTSLQRTSGSYTHGLSATQTALRSLAPAFPPNRSPSSSRPPFQHTRHLQRRPPLCVPRSLLLLAVCFDHRHTLAYMTCGCNGHVASDVCRAPSPGKQYFFYSLNTPHRRRSCSHRTTWQRPPSPQTRGGECPIPPT